MSAGDNCRRRFGPVRPLRAAGATLAGFLVVAAAAGPLPVRPAGAEQSALAGGTATGRGVFATYSDRDTVIEGGTVAAPDLGSPVVETAVDLTGLGSALAALGYSPYSDAAGVLNAFGGTELPLDEFGERSRAKVTGRPPQEQQVGLPGGTAGSASARLADGPTAQASTLAAGTEVPGVTIRLGDLQATVERSTEATAAGSKVTVVLRSVRIGDALAIDRIVLSATARADGAAGTADATSVVEGVTLGGHSVRLTPSGFEPVGAAGPDLSALEPTGLEVLGSGEAVSTPDGRQAEARASGPRLRWKSADGRLLTVVLGEARATSTFVPATGDG